MLGRNQRKDKELVGVRSGLKGKRTWQQKASGDQTSSVGVRFIETLWEMASGGNAGHVRVPGNRELVWWPLCLLMCEHCQDVLLAFTHTMQMNAHLKHSCHTKIYPNTEHAGIQMYKYIEEQSTSEDSTNLFLTKRGSHIQSCRNTHAHWEIMMSSHSQTTHDDNIHL